MTTQSSFPNELPFFVSARTMRMLGRENVSSPIVALTELVKNAYDADATEVKVTFRRASTSEGCIRIDDNGDGMNLDDLRENWMVIGTDNKLSDLITRHNRVRVGEKGIGRLALDRLAKHTTVITHREGYPALRLEIDWTKYESSDNALDEITHPLSTPPDIQAVPRGTSLILTGLRDKWTKESYHALCSDLALLVSPFDSNLADFKIVLDCDEALDLSGPISSPMPAVAEYKLDSILSAKGDIHHVLTHRSGEVKEDSRSWAQAFDDVPPGTMPRCGPLRFRLYFYLREARSVKGIDIKRAELIRFLDSFQGIRIYRDGFRVKPYGDPASAEDWLGLNARRVRHPGGVRAKVGEWVLAENQVVGSIYISRADNPDLIDQTNREGLVHNQAYRDLRRFVLHGIQFLERERQLRIRRESPAGKEEIDVQDVVLEQSRKLERLAKGLRDVGQVTRMLFPRETTHLEAAAAEIETAVARLGEARDTLVEEQTEKQLMIGLATLGIAMATFGHETHTQVTEVLDRAQLLAGAVKSISKKLRSKARQDLRKLIRAAERVEAWGQFALQRIKRSKRVQQEVDMKVLSDEILEAFSATFEEWHINIVRRYGQRIPPFRCFAMDIESILINFITNALEAMRHTSLNARQIEIAITCLPQSNELELVFADSGKGIKPEDISKVFDPLFSTKVDARGEPTGTGMGLAIVRNTINEYGGEIEVEGHGKLGGAVFRVTLPYSCEGKTNRR